MRYVKLELKHRYWAWQKSWFTTAARVRELLLLSAGGILIERFGPKSNLSLVMLSCVSQENRLMMATLRLVV